MVSEGSAAVAGETYQMFISSSSQILSHLLPEPLQFTERPSSS